MQKLLESEFTTVNIKSIFNRNQDSADAETTQADEAAKTAEDNSEAAEQTTDSERGIDWTTELDKRLEANRRLHPESRRDEYDIEKAFFTEYFNANFDSDCAKQLILLGDKLMKAIRVLGFNKKINPILGFINVKYVQEKLIKTRLLNINTFKAIYAAVENKLVADSEFFSSNNYNIIYCQDLYKKSSKEMIDYLTQQSHILKVTAKKYTVDDQAKNKKIFIYLPKIKELEPNNRLKQIKSFNGDLPSVKSDSSKLNDYSFVDLAVKNFDNTKAVGGSHLNTKGQLALADKLTTASEIFAAIQFLSISTDSSKAAAALSNDVFSQLSPEQIAKAAQRLAAESIMPKGKLNKTDADALVEILLGKLQTR